MASASFSRYGAGSLVGANYGTVATSYAQGGRVHSSAFAGGLVGQTFSNSVIIASYSTVPVHLSFLIRYGGVGGLVGSASAGSKIIASYSSGRVTGNNPRFMGALLSEENSVLTLFPAVKERIVNSYGDVNVSGLNDSFSGRTSDELKSPTNYTGIYAGWNVDLDNADNDNNLTSNGDDPWHFGTPYDYPVLKYADQNTGSQRNDYDADDNNLIEIKSLGAT